MFDFCALRMKLLPRYLLSSALFASAQRCIEYLAYRRENEIHSSEGATPFRNIGEKRSTFFAFRIKIEAAISSRQ